jgi:pimeloyl-ACP methyl ester carboxylesterase
MSVTASCPSAVGISRRLCRRGSLAGAAIALVVALAWAGPVRAAEEEQPRLPAPVAVSGPELISNGIQLSATFYPGTKGQDSVPVVLLHMWKGDRKEYAALAPYLQQQGHAVLEPDLRGHGESAQSPYGGGKLDAAKMGPDQFYLMPYGDMEVLRKFLVKKNDEGELNLNKLCIVGAEMGASVAAYYAFYDWTTPRREAGRAAPAQDVKALVLISPDWSFKGLPINKPLSNPAVASQISAMIVAGKEDSGSSADARRVYKLFERYHGDPNAVAADQRDLFFIQPPTSLKGTKMLDVKGLRVEWAIGRFIELRLLNKDFPWYKRAS